MSAISAPIIPAPVIPALITPTAPVAKIVNKQRIVGGGWTITLRINDNPKTDTNHVIHATAVQSRADVTAWLVACKQRAVASHLASVALDAMMPDIE